MANEMILSRRHVLKRGAALVVGFYLPEKVRGLAGVSNDMATFKPNAWVRIARDNGITILSEVPEMGQGTRTAGVMMLADELEVEWSSIQCEQAPTIPQTYKHLTTGGSGGTEATWLPMRRAGAQAREVLIAAAAHQWGVDKSECRAKSGAVFHEATQQRLPYGELIATALTLPAGDLERVPLKDPKDFRFIGKAMGRVDMASKVDGSAIFGMDVRLPGMLFAVIARCPQFGGKMASFDASDAKAVPGVKAVFAVPAIGYVAAIQRSLNVVGGVAVVANSTWAALEGRKALNITWEKGPGAQESSAGLREQFRKMASGPPSVVPIDRGNSLEALANASHKMQADYEIPFQAHATMEPMNTTVHVRGDGSIEVWSPTQGGDLAQSTIAQLAGVAAEKVTVNVTYSGGSFGRRYQWDYLAESYQVAKEMTVPVQLLWTREDDMQHDFYLQYSYQRMTGALDNDGGIVAWWHRIVSTPIRAVFDSPKALEDPKHVASQDIIAEDNLPYQSEHYRLDYAPVQSAVPRAWWRSVSSSFHFFAIECFIDEMAHAAGRDPLEYRLKMLRADRAEQTAKLRGVLQLAAEKSGWGKPLPANSGRGVACNAFGGTYVAHVAEVSVTADGIVHVDRMISAVDCGLAVNPDSVRAQIEGAINFTLTPTLFGEISVKDGAIEQNNFHQYQVLRMKDAPEIEVHLVNTTADPRGGVGEGGVPATPPAVANAIFAATGKRVRRLPLAKLA